MIEYYPRTTEPVPALLTEEEAVRFLRLDSEGRDLRLAKRAFLHLVECKRIQPCRVGKYRRYLREELIRFLRHQTNPGRQSVADVTHFEGFEGSSNCKSFGGSDLRSC